MRPESPGDTRLPTTVWRWLLTIQISEFKYKYHSMEVKNQVVATNIWIETKTQVKREVVASALATSNIKATARKYNIEESTIRAWVKKQKAGTGVSQDVPRKEHFQQKYSEQVLLLFHHPNDIFIYFVSVQNRNCGLRKDHVTQRDSIQIQCSGTNHQVLSPGFEMLIISRSGCGWCKHKVYPTSKDQDQRPSSRDPLKIFS